MKMKSVASDKAKRRLRKKLREIKEQEDEQERIVKEKIRKIHEDQEAEKLRLELEEEERIRVEEEKRKKTYQPIKPQEKQVYRIKKKDEK